MKSVLIVIPCLLLGCAFRVSAEEESKPIEQRIRTYDRDKDGRVDRRVTRYVQEDILQRMIHEEDINYDGTFDSKVDTWYKGKRESTTYWQNLALGTAGRIFWHNGNQLMIEVDNDADQFFELRMFLDPEKGIPVAIFDISKTGVIKPVEKSMFEECRKSFMKERGVVSSALKEYARNQKEIAKRRADEEKQAPEATEAE